MTTTFVPGYMAEITLNVVDYTVYGNVIGVSARKATPRKPVFGSSGQRVISGQQTWALQLAGHVAAEGPLTAILAAFAADTPIAFTVQVGEAAGATDVGEWSGNLVLSSLEVRTDAEGEWEFSANAEIDDTPTFTPAV